MKDRGQRSRLLRGGTLQQEPHVCLAKIRRNVDLGHRYRSHSGIVQLVVDQLVQFLAEAGRDSFCAAGVQISAYNENRMRRGLVLALFMVGASAQTVQVYSEFARLGDAGEPLAPATPREILSPAVPRNAYSTFQIAVQVPAGNKFNLFIGQNPEDAVKITLYRGAKEKLEAVGIPYEGIGSQVVWLDVWVDASAPVRRVKVEPQVFINGDWVTYPMEMRVSETVVPEGAMREPGPEEVLCGPRKNGPSQADWQLRNARQDAALLAHSSPAQREAARRALGGCDAKPPSTDPEYYLRLRDLFVSPGWQKMR